MTQATGRRAPRGRRTTDPQHSEPTRVGALVIGSGFAGLGAAIRLTQQGYTDFVVLERGSEVGGTWRDNTYPGAACDVPSHLYSYSFELNPNWSRSFSPQSEIQDYLRRTAVKYGVLDKHRFGTTMTSAEWDEDENHWVVQTTAGTYLATLLVPAVGALAEPALPDIAGIDSFQGEIFHSSRWNHEASLEGERVAVIGTGASAIQIVPAIADRVEHLDVYQRTAPWILPRRDRAYSTAEHLAYQHIPGLQRLARESIYWSRELAVLGFAFQPKILLAAQRQAERHIRSQVKDKALRSAVTPTWQIGCKRILLSNDWYPTLGKEHVDLVTDGIREIRRNAIVTADGTVREVDAIVVATGFHVTDSPSYDLIKGVDGKVLGDLWREHGQSAYKGATVAGFPNMIFVIGPNMGLGHSSMVYMAESAINYLASAVQTMQEHDLARVEVKEDVQREYNAKLQQRMQRTIWTTGGCASWYLDAHGRNTTLWPGFTFTFRALTRSFDLAAYRSIARSDRAVARATSEERTAQLRDKEGVSA